MKNEILNTKKFFSLQMNVSDNCNLNFILIASEKTSIKMLSQPVIACSKLTIETLEQGVKYVQS